MMKPLTERQTQILEFVRERVAADGCPPTVREIAAEFGFASTNSVRCHLAAIEKKGYIERSFHASRGIKLAEEVAQRWGLPIVGRVAAGTPITAVENREGFLSIESVHPRDAQIFCLRVQGDSMVDAGILDGDYVIVRQKPDFEDGEIGVAAVDEEATVKQIRRSGKWIQLIPANEAYEMMCIDPSETEFRYAGEVTGVHRVLK